MAIIDANVILCDKQVITDTTYSQRAIDFKALADYGVGVNRYVACSTQGDFSTALRVQVLGCKDDTFTDPVILGDSGVKKITELTFGSRFYIRINETGKKYRYLLLRIIPTTQDGHFTETVQGNDNVDITNFAAPTKVLEKVTPIADALRAEIVDTAALGTMYGYANADKATA